VKELVVLGVLASHGLQYGVEAHMRRAIAYGATKEELFEAIKAAGPGGGVAYSVGAGRSKHWARSYVVKILGDRSVLGEWQPRRDGKPYGEPIGR